MKEILGQDGFSLNLEKPLSGGRSAEVEQWAPAGDLPAAGVIRGNVMFSDLLGGGTVAVTCLNPEMTDLDLAREAEGRDVIGISPRAFENCRNLRRILLPETLEEIGEMAFAGCRSLTEVTIPGSVRKIGTLAFARCGLQRVTLLPGVEILGPSCFSRNQGLQRVDIPDSVQSFGGGVFFLCGRSLVICCSEKSTAAAYARANALTFNSHAWELESTLCYEEGEDGLIFTGLRDRSAIRVEIPAEISGVPVTQIRENACRGETGLIQVTLGKNIRRIGAGAFSACSGLSLVIFDGCEQVGERAFAGCVQLRQALLPGGTELVERQAFFGCCRLMYVRLGAGTRVAAGAFDGCAPDLRVLGGIRV